MSSRLGQEVGGGIKERDQTMDEDAVKSFQR